MRYLLLLLVLACGDDRAVPFDGSPDGKPCPTFDTDAIPCGVIVDLVCGDARSGYYRACPDGKEMP